jgi:hypothetical protein
MIVGTILYGLVMCDEMKLDENVLWDTKSHAAHGFAGDFESLDRSIQAELTGNTEKQPAVEVNQWKYRAINGKEMLSFECEFFYNDGSLSNASPSHFKPRANQLPSYRMGYRWGFEEHNVDEELVGEGSRQDTSFNRVARHYLPVLCSPG